MSALPPLVPRCRRAEHAGCSTNPLWIGFCFDIGCVRCFEFHPASFVLSLSLLYTSHLSTYRRCFERKRKADLSPARPSFGPTPPERATEVAALGGAAVAGVAAAVEEAVEDAGIRAVGAQVVADVVIRTRGSNKMTNNSLMPLTTRTGVGAEANATAMMAVAEGGGVGEHAEGAEGAGVGADEVAEAGEATTRRRRRLRRPLLPRNLGRNWEGEEGQRRRGRPVHGDPRAPKRKAARLKQAKL